MNNLELFFREHLGYRTILRCDLTKAEFEQCLLDVKDEFLTRRSDEFHCFVVIVMSHGNEVGEIDDIIEVLY